MKKMEALRKKGVDSSPSRSTAARSPRRFWGKAWCDHLESFSDFENRLPRGRTYVRNGSVCHLAIAKGSIEAKVSGSELYTVKVSIKTLPSKKWTSLKQRSAGQVGSLLELLQGKLSDHVMEVVTDRKEGLFPAARRNSFHCSCPDWASMCKHVAAVFYGVGARLDAKPELLFLLRGVNHEELIQADAEKAVAAATSRGKSRRIAASEIGEVFGIDIDPVAAADSATNIAANKPARRRAPAERSATAKADKTLRKRTPEAKAKTKKSASKKTAKKCVAKKAKTKAA